MKVLLVIAVLACGPATVSAASHGELRRNATGAVEVWDIGGPAWVDVEMFWERFAKSQGGLSWGRSSTYPPFEQVKERDLFIVEVEEGPCLMEFFHGRWRRANDVRRWDDAMNEVAGCAHVFGAPH